MIGRGLYKDEGVLHEFQTASITNPDQETNKYIIEECKKLNNNTNPKAKHIPTLPEQVTIDYVEDKITDISKMHIGINQKTLSVVTHDFTITKGTTVTSININYLKNFAVSLATEFKKLQNTTLVIFDPKKELEKFGKSINNYYYGDFDNIVDKLNNYIDKTIKTKKNTNIVIMIYSVSKFIDSISSMDRITDLLQKYENISLVVFDSASQLKGYLYDDWYKKYFDASGIYVGHGVSDQSVLKISSYSKELSKEVPTNIGFYINEGQYKIIKLIEFEKMNLGDDDE